MLSHSGFVVRVLQITFLFLIWPLSTWSIPHWDGFLSRNSMDDLSYGGAHPLEAIMFSSPRQKFLSTINRGSPGNMTLRWPASQNAPTFFINQGELFHFVNDSTIYPVNLLNTTGMADRPLQLVLGNARAGFNGGFWKWHGTMLYYDYGRWGNQGIFYRCPSNEKGQTGVYTHIHPASRPRECEDVTLHSFLRDPMGRRKSQYPDPAGGSQ